MCFDGTTYLGNCFFFALFHWCFILDNSNKKEDWQIKPVRSSGIQTWHLIQAWCLFHCPFFENVSCEKNKLCLHLTQQTQLVFASLKSLELLIILTLVQMGSMSLKHYKYMSLFLPLLLHLHLHTEALDHTVSTFLHFRNCVIALNLPSGLLTLSTRSLHWSSCLCSWIWSFTEGIVVLEIENEV